MRKSENHLLNIFALFGGTVIFLWYFINRNNGGFGGVVWHVIPYFIVMILPHLIDSKSFRLYLLIVVVLMSVTDILAVIFSIYPNSLSLIFSMLSVGKLFIFPIISIPIYLLIRKSIL